MGMFPIKAHGAWNGVNPFLVTTPPLSDTTPLAVLTRASIRWQSLWSFWRSAPKAAHALDKARGLLFSCGIGELPFVRQATFSVWENLAAMKAFAYGNANHREAMRAKAEKPLDGLSRGASAGPTTPFPVTFSRLNTWRGGIFLRTLIVIRINR